MVRPGGQRSHLNTQSLKKSLPPSPAVTKTEDFEDILSYLRDYIATCKEKKDSFFVSLCY